MYEEFKKNIICSVDELYEIDMDQNFNSLPDKNNLKNIKEFTDDLFDTYASCVGGVIIDYDNACYIDNNILSFFCMIDSNNNKINRIDKDCVYLGCSYKNSVNVGNYIDIEGKKYKVQGFLKRNSYIILPNLTDFDKYVLDDYILGEMEIEYELLDSELFVNFERIANLFIVSKDNSVVENIKKIADKNNIILNDVNKISTKQRLYRKISEPGETSEMNYAIILFIVSIVSVLIISYISIEKNSYRFWVMIMNGFLRSEILTIILSEIFLRGLVSFLAGAIYLYYTLMIEEDLNELRYYIIPLIVIEVIMIIVQFIFSSKIFHYKIEKVANGGKY